MSNQKVLSRRRFVQQAAFTAPLAVPALGLAGVPAIAMGEVVSEAECMRRSFPNLVRLGEAVVKAGGRAKGSYAAARQVANLHDLVLETQESLAEGRVVTVDGWVFSEEEIDLCVALYESSA